MIICVAWLFKYSSSPVLQKIAIVHYWFNINSREIIISLSMGSFNFWLIANFIATRGSEFKNVDNKLAPKYLQFDTNDNLIYYDCLNTFLLLKFKDMNIKLTLIIYIYIIIKI